MVGPFRHAKLRPSLTEYAAPRRTSRTAEFRRNWAQALAGRSRARPRHTADPASRTTPADPSATLSSCRPGNSDGRSLLRDGYVEQLGGYSRGPDGGCPCATRSVPSSSSRSHRWPIAPIHVPGVQDYPGRHHPRRLRRHRGRRMPHQGRSAPGAGPRLGNSVLCGEVPRLLRRGRHPRTGRRWQELVS